MPKYTVTICQYSTVIINSETPKTHTQLKEIALNEIEHNSPSVEHFKPQISEIRLEEDISWPTL